MLLENAVPESKKNSKLKGGIAIALGAALLAGGGGTLAYWSTNQTLGATSISTGDLDLQLGAATWTLTHGSNEVEVDAADIPNLKIVPGDKLELVQVLNVTLEGKNLAADLAIDTTDVSEATSVTVTAALPGDVTTQTLTPATAENPIEATVTVVFDEATAGQVDVKKAVNLNAIDFTLTQVAN